MHAFEIMHHWEILTIGALKSAKSQKLGRAVTIMHFRRTQKPSYWTEMLMVNVSSFV